MSFLEESRALLSGSANAAVPPEWGNYMRSRQAFYNRVLPGYVEQNMRSEAMWVLRGKCRSGTDIGISVEAGDICWMDYGQTFLNEMGYQHFGLIMSLFHKKAMVIPLTSNPQAYEKAGEPGSTGSHLFRIGQPEGLNKPSTLFLNDMRFINTARILTVRAHINPDSDLFRSIQARMIEILKGV